MQVNEETRAGGGAPGPPAPAKLRGIAIGRERTVSLVEKLRAQRADEKPEAYAAFLERWSPFLEIELTVRHQSRRKVQTAGLQIDALANVVDDPSKRYEILDVTRAFLKDRVIHPKTGADLGPVLVRVTGAEAELDDGTVLDLGQVADTEQLLDLLEDMDLLELAGTAAVRAQQPTRVQGN